MTEVCSAHMVAMDQKTSHQKLPADLRAHRWLYAWNLAIETGKLPDPRTSDHAFLVGGLSNSGLRDTLLHTALYGRESAVSAAVWLNVLPEAVADRAGVVPNERDAVLYSAALIGQGRRTPKLGRLWALCDALQILAPTCQGVSWSAAQTLIGWTHWAVGDTESAATAITEVREQAPDYSLAQLVEELIGRGVTPGWPR